MNKSNEEKYNLICGFVFMDARVQVRTPVILFSNFLSALDGADKDFITTCKDYFALYGLRDEVQEDRKIIS